MGAMAIPPPRADGVCIVTGASSGIGAQIARRLAARGMGLALVARRPAPLEALASELASAHHVRVEVLAADLTDDAARAGIASDLADRDVVVDVLVNAAGFSTMGPVARSDRAREVAMVRTNVEAVVDLCSLFVPGMVERGRGAVLNVASTAAFQPIPGQAGYAASKSFVLSYTHALRGELTGSGVTATALCPGPVKTGFFEAAGIDESSATSALPSFMWVDAATVAAVAVDGIDRGRAVVIPGAANKVAAGAAYLSPRSLIVPLLAKRHPAMGDTRST
jgi:short-subunit dehydrogenase